LGKASIEPISLAHTRSRSLLIPDGRLLLSLSFSLSFSLSLSPSLSSHFLSYFHLSLTLTLTLTHLSLISLSSHSHLVLTHLTLIILSSHSHSSHSSHSHLTLTRLISVSSHLALISLLVLLQHHAGSHGNLFANHLFIIVPVRIEPPAPPGRFPVRTCMVKRLKCSNALQRHIQSWGTKSCVKLTTHATVAATAAVVVRRRLGQHGHRMVSVSRPIWPRTSSGIRLGTRLWPTWQCFRNSADGPLLPSLKSCRMRVQGRLLL
jgi:hypothetical protein